MSKNFVESHQDEIEMNFGNFIYAIAPHKAIKKLEFVTPKEMYITTDEKVIHIRERTPEKMYTRAIFEVLHNI